jgi:chromosomal replication initiator protein
MEAVWNKVKNVLKSKVSNSSYRMWIEPVKFAGSDNNLLKLACANSFSKQWIQNHFGELIVSEASQIYGTKVGLSFDICCLEAAPVTAAPKEVQLALPNFVVRSHSGRFLRKEYTFDQYVVGDNNALAFSASLAMASKPKRNQQSLFLCSGTGMGKSHLSQAIGHHVIDKFPGERVYYITAEDFTNEMVQAFRHDSLDQFKHKYRTGCDVLLLEDVHYLSGKQRTQSELAMTLDSLMESDKKVIYSSCFLPFEIPKISKELRSRLSFALISEIEPPNFKTRVRILKKKCAQNGHKLPNEVMQYLASELTEDVRQLESGLIGLTARASLLGKAIDIELAEAVVKHITQCRRTITVDAIKKLVCREFKVSAVDIVSKSRKKNIVRPRHIAIYLSRRYTDSPLQAIGKSFNRYHATAMHAIGAVEKGMREKGPLKQQVDILCKKLESGSF